MFNYEEIFPENCFRFYIRKFWILDNSVSALPTIAKFVLPNTCFTLAFISGNGLILEYPDKHAKLGFGNYLVGELTTGVRITVLPYTKAFMVQLNPWTPSLLSNLPYDELTNQFAPLADINKNLADSFKLGDIRDNQSFKTLINKILENYLYPTTSSALIASCFDQIRNRPIGDLIKITDLSINTGYSVRSLEKKFKQHVGLSPKQFYMILRVRSLVNELTFSKGEKLSLTALAYRYGFVDQAHFIRTYSNIMNSVPSKFNKGDYILPLAI